ncbi:hypothetical protein Q5M85_17785 [Paraclostridium bifermentans]|nr:hypothetical protein [Paraclostridium bifermentans]
MTENRFKMDNMKMLYNIQEILNTSLSMNDIISKKIIQVMKNMKKIGHKDNNK